MPQPTDRDLLNQFSLSAILLRQIQDTLADVEEFMPDVDKLLFDDSSGLHEFDKCDGRDFVHHLTSSGMHLRDSQRILASYHIKLSETIAGEGITAEEYPVQQDEE